MPYIVELEGTTSFPLNEGSLSVEELSYIREASALVSSIRRIGRTSQQTAGNFIDLTLDLKNYSQQRTQVQADLYLVPELEQSRVPRKVS